MVINCKQLLKRFGAAPGGLWGRACAGRCGLGGGGRRLCGWKMVVVVSMDADAAHCVGLVAGVATVPDEQRTSAARLAGVGDAVLEVVVLVAVGIVLAVEPFLCLNCGIGGLFYGGLRRGLRSMVDVGRNPVESVR